MAVTGVPAAPVDPTAAPVDADGWPVLSPTLLSVHRVSTEDIKDRQVILSLDGRKIGTLLFGHRLTVEIPPGRHRLRANNTLVWKTVEFDAPPGGHVHFTCVNRAPASLYFMLFLFGVAPLYVTLEPGAPSSDGGPPAAR
jgi:hypothetical protein